ncbi:hypothetical protein QBC46DRAFT_370559 [Diplogelasinospora grovesii]|uniref:DUF6536 domain-containing protein n=1 Tax=Diplogelasinospora grovesii TaxID=303347 RepID=A0AAN6NI83_9PEZI|nr:hypothetical protein QBC46DRAFT_370559 [Diplogelasinospora grovesii]
MEIVIPPRDHGPSTYRYTWDENGEVEQVTRVREDLTTQEQRERIERLRRGRQTVQWPFQSMATETEISSPTVTSAPFGRRATWQPKRLRDDDEDSVERDIVPDYVINYIRGETPETVARRKRNGGKLGERGVDIEHQHRPHQSRVADFEGFFNDGSSSRPHTTDDEHQRMLEKQQGDNNNNSSRGWRRFMASGWRTGIAMNLVLSFLVLVVGFVCLMVGLARNRSLLTTAGQMPIFAGSCSTASNISWGLHALINVLVVVLIAGANYTFQILSSPTRSEVDAAHGRKRWLDIGIPSVRNFGHIQWTRSVLAVILLLAALATQIMYNAVITTSQPAADYKLVVVTQSFLKGAQFSNDTSNNAAMLSRLDILALQDQASRNELVNLTTTQCVQQFEGAFETTYSAALLVTNSNSQSSSLLQTLSAPTRINSGGVVDLSTVQYCLAQPNTGGGQTCSVNLDGPLLGIVVLLNLLTVLLISAVLFTRWSGEPLVTLGDALRSFLTEPDGMTKGCCLLSKHDVWQGRWGPNQNLGGIGRENCKYWVPRDHYWFHTPSSPRWVFVIFVWAICAGLAAAALAICVHADPNGKLSGFGAASPYTVITVPQYIAGGTGVVVLGALPQVLLGVLYLCVNGLLTTYWLSHESSLFALVHKPRALRVSNHPEGEQMTSLYLTLTRPVSWFLVVVFAGMGFAVSQSVFTTTIQGGSSASVVVFGFSGVGLLSVLAVLVLLAVVVLGLGFRRAPAAGSVNGQAIGNPLTLPAGSCSAVLSARCHPPLVEVRRQRRERREVGLENQKLVWGVVPPEGIGMNMSHCTYTARQASRLDMARSYA